MKIWRGFCSIVKKINKINLYLAVACVIAMTALITTEIISRTFFNKSTLICDEYTGYLLCAMTFFGGAYALSKGAFLRVDIIYERVRPKLRKALDVINWLVALVYTVFLLKFCYGVFIYSWRDSVVSIYHSRTPLAYPQVIMVLGCVLLLVQVLVELVNVLISEPHAAPQKKEAAG